MSQHDTPHASTYEVVSVKDGKFHRPADTLFARDGASFRTPRPMKCGLSLVPHNFFQTIEDADKHTGGRIAQYACAHCERATKRAG